MGKITYLAARLESLTRLYGVTALVSESTRDQAADTRFRLIDRVQVKGKTQVETIYEPLSDDFDDKRLQLHVDAMQSYFAGDWPQANSIFAQLGQEPADSLLYQLFQNRCAELQANPPDDWNGVQKFRQK